MPGHPQDQLRVDISAATLDRINGAIRHALEKGKYEAWIRPKRRSNPQNDQIHVLLREIAKKTGHTVGEIKEYVKVEFLGTKEVEINGNYREIPRPTSDLSTMEASDFIGQLEAFIHEL
jgi:hypothetical protein